MFSALAPIVTRVTVFRTLKRIKNAFISYYKTRKSKILEIY